MLALFVVLDGVNRFNTIKFVFLLTAVNKCSYNFSFPPFFFSACDVKVSAKLLHRFHCESHMLIHSIDIACRLHQSDVLGVFLIETGMSVIENVGERAKEKHIDCDTT